MRFAFIEAHRPQWQLRTMCRMLQASRAEYFAWRDGREST
jgi:hypothetical protein